MLDFLEFLELKKIKMENQNKQTQDFAHEKAIYEWSAPEYIQYSKDRRWFTVAGIVVAGLIFYGVIWGSPFFSLAMAVLSAVYYLQHNQPLRQIKIKVTGMGLKIDQKFFPFSNLKSFWIVYNPPEVTTLNFRTVNNLHGELTLQLGDMNPIPIREYLARQLPEEEGKTEGLMNKLIRIFRL